MLKAGIIRVRGGISQTTSLTSLRATEAVTRMAGLVGGTGANNRANFQQIVKKLNCVPADTSLTEPNNAAYVFNGAYTPLACRIVEESLKCNGQVTNTPLGEALRMMPGEPVIQWSGDTTNKVREAANESKYNAQWETWG